MTRQCICRLLRCSEVRHVPSASCQVNLRRFLLYAAACGFSVSLAVGGLLPTSLLLLVNAAAPTYCLCTARNSSRYFFFFFFQRLFGWLSHKNRNIWWTLFIDLLTLQFQSWALGDAKIMRMTQRYPSGDHQGGTVRCYSNSSMF